MARLSPTTQRLVALLQRYPRRQIGELLLHQTDAEQALLDGSLDDLLAATLQAQAPPNAGKIGLSALLSSIANFDGNVVGWFDEEYPAVWRHIPDPPLTFYIRGAALTDLSAAGQLFAVVGSRRASEYGRRTATEIATCLAQHGAIVVSGLAYGIDIAAHRGAVAVSGPTVAILGGGLSKVYPAAHRRDAQQVLRTGGSLVSEYAPTATARPYHFLERNRLISGLSAAVVVVEAAHRSGALNTARTALEQGREVWAVPGSIHNPQAAGCHQLISQGAQVVTHPGCLLDQPQATTVAQPEGALAQQVVALCLSAPMEIEQLMLGLSPTPEYLQLVSLLTDLELDGFVQSTTLGYIATSKK